MTYSTDIHVRGVSLHVAFDATPYVPATMYRPNGDPGEPAEGGDIEILGVEILDTEIDRPEFVFSQDFLDLVEQAVAEQVGDLDAAAQAEVDAERDADRRADYDFASAP